MTTNKKPAPAATSAGSNRNINQDQSITKQSFTQQQVLAIHRHNFARQKQHLPRQCKEIRLLKWIKERIGVNADRILHVNRTVRI